jgi:hypothetical protein
MAQIPKDPKAAKDSGRLLEYFWANVIFWVFLVALTVSAWMVCQEPGDDVAVQAVLVQTVLFSILLFGVGFTLVTLFDWAYDFFAARAEDGGH